MLIRNGGRLSYIRQAFSISTPKSAPIRPDAGAFKQSERFDQPNHLGTKLRTKVENSAWGKAWGRTAARQNEIGHFHNVNFILIDFEAIEDHVCEFPAIHVKNGIVQNIFHSYCRAPKIADKRWDQFGQHFFGVKQDFYLNQPTFSTVEWNFCKWAKYHKLFIEEPRGCFSLNHNVAFVVQGTGDFFFLHRSLEINKVSRKLRPCYDNFYDLDRLWELADVGRLPNTPRMHNMAKAHNLDVVSDVHSGMHDTLQLHIVFDFLRTHLNHAKKPYVIAGARTAFQPRKKA